LFLALADLTEKTDHHQLTITLRDLCKHAGIAKGAFPEALRALEERNLITTRHGSNHQKSRYQVNWWDTIRGSFSDPPNQIGASSSDPQMALTLTHDGSNSDPQTDPAGMPMPHARVPSNSDFHFPIPILDRVLKSDPRDFDQPTLQHLAGRVHSYMAKFGRHHNGENEGKLYIDTPGDPPEPPDRAIMARIMAIAEPPGIAQLLDQLWCEAGMKLAMHPHQENPLQPRTYGWFVTVGLSKIHGIEWRVTAQANADWHVHKRGQQPPTTSQLQAAIRKLANAKSMDRR
jgi:hypothetical protein